MAGLGGSPVIAESCGCGNSRSPPWSWTRPGTARAGAVGPA